MGYTPENYINPERAGKFFEKAKELFGEAKKGRLTEERKKGLVGIIGELCCFLYPSYSDDPGDCGRNKFIGKKLWGDMRYLGEEIRNYLNLVGARALHSDKV